MAPLRRGQYAHGLAVFGNGSAGDLDRVIGQHGGDMLIAKRLAGIFGSNDRADLFLNALTRDIVTATAHQATLEKKLELK
jgi:hypothetical protein